MKSSLVWRLKYTHKYKFVQLSKFFISGANIFWNVKGSLVLRLKSKYESKYIEKYNSCESLSAATFL